MKPDVIFTKLYKICMAHLYVKDMMKIDLKMIHNCTKLQNGETFHDK